MHNKEKKLILISSDASILNENSAAQLRMKEYSALFKELHIVIRNLSIIHTGHEPFEPVMLTKNAWVYPTHSRAKIFSLIDLYLLANKVIGRIQQPKNECIIDTQDPFEHGLIGYLLSRKNSISLRLQVHTDIYSPYFTKPFFLNTIRRKSASLLLRRANSIRVVSDRIKRSLNERGVKVPIIVLPLFVEMKSPLPAVERYPQFDTVYITASRLTKEKNLSFLISTFVEFQKKNAKAGLVIVGEGPEKKSLQTQVASLGVAGHVIFEGWQKDIRPFLAAADAYVNTSYYEGYGISLLEAAMQGLPIITSDVGIVGEVFSEESAKIIRGFAVEKWLSALEEIQSRPEIRTQYGQKALTAASEHLSHNRQEYLKKYQDALLSV